MTDSFTAQIFNEEMHLSLKNNINLTQILYRTMNEVFKHKRPNRYISKLLLWHQH